MAQIKCSECGQEVSDTSASCPKCGYPLKGNRGIRLPFNNWREVSGAVIFLLGLALLIWGFISTVSFVQRMDSYTFWFIVFLMGMVITSTTIYVVVIFNRLIKLRNETRKCWGNVQVHYQRRVDLISKLIEVTQKYAVHEKDLLTDVTRLRSQWGEAKSTGEKIKTAESLDSAVGRLIAVSENYPDLKANQTFLQLQNELVATEGKIADTRTNYNNAIAPYNYGACSFPSNIVAKIFGFKEMDFYSVGK